MRVICIKQFTKEVENRNPVPPIKFGEIYTQVDESEYNGEKFIALQEFRWEDRFKKSYFAPLSSIDETEMERNYKTEKV